MRRERYNIKRRRRNVEEALSLMKPVYACYIAAGFLDLADAFGGHFQTDLLAGALLTDRRLIRKMFVELDLIDRVINAPPAWVVDVEDAHRKAEAAESIAYSDVERTQFEMSLLPIPVPDADPQTIPFHQPSDDHATETSSPAAAQVAS